MIKSNFWRIEYLQTKSGGLSFVEKVFSRLLTVSCAEFWHDDRLRCCGLPCSWGMTTVFTAMKSLVVAMTTVFMVIERQIKRKSTFSLYKEG
ncbi:hypothetical protein [Parabacteroides massiliensis]|uniref:hypothetical protein n=1 Tax=Parabacteroides massiliensis TaxID=1750560 RepID=UPI00096A6824|nr:hypothetical protein [Parabacteroides massiliensis]